MEERYRPYRFRDLVYAYFKVRRMDEKQLEDLQKSLPLDESWTILERVASERYTQETKKRERNYKNFRFGFPSGW